MPDTAALFNEDTLQAFLRETGWRKMVAIGQDTSIRRYFRAEKNGKTAILMESVPDHSPHMTRGHKMADFIRIGKWLRDNGLNAPDVYEADLEQGYMILEDFGDTSFKKAIERGEDQAQLYGMAAEALNIMSRAEPLADLPHYYDSHVHANHQFVITHYAQESGALEGYHSAWAEVEAQLPPPRLAVLHIDFHAENLMLMPDRKGVQRCGILDFQGAMIGPAAYDVANLLEDARQDVSPDVRDYILSHYDSEFRAHYRVLAAQFHCRVLGQFIKIATDMGNSSYLAHLPRLEGYMRESLKNPLLKPVKDFFDDLKVDFSLTNDLNSEEIQHLITTRKTN